MVVAPVELPVPSEALVAAGLSLLVPSEPPDPAEAPSVDVLSAFVALDAAFERLASRASFFAQPDPLNTIAGADRARFIGPPQRSHVAGPGAEIPWITSTTWPHDSQA